MPPSELSTVFTDEDSMEGLLSATGRELRVDDDADQTPQNDFTTWAANIGTARVLTYTATRYEVADLATSWSVWHWATVIACYWLCCRRGNPVPTSLLGLYEETMEELKEVLAGDIMIDDLAMRNIRAPAWSNGRLDDRYAIRKYRIQTPLSESTPIRFPRNVDRGADVVPEPPLII